MFFYYKPNDKMQSITFELIDNPIIEELTCGICYELFDKPSQTECNHRFCIGCIDAWFGTDFVKNCPNCRANILKVNLKNDPFVESIISKLKVKCSEKMCTHTFTVNDIKKHLYNECEYAMQECKFGCEEMIKKKEIENHYDVFAKIHAEKMYKKMNEKIFISIPNVSQKLIEIRNIQIEIENRKKRRSKWNDIQDSKISGLYLPILKILCKKWKGKEIPKNIIEKCIEEGVSVLLNNFYVEDHHDKIDLQNKYAKLVNVCFQRYECILTSKDLCRVYEIPYDEELAEKIHSKFLLRYRHGVSLPLFSNLT